MLVLGDQRARRRHHVPETTLGVESLAMVGTGRGIIDVEIQRRVLVGNDPAAGGVGVAPDERRVDPARDGRLLSGGDLQWRPGNSTRADAGDFALRIGHKGVKRAALTIDQHRP